MATTGRRREAAKSVHAVESEDSEGAQKVPFSTYITAGARETLREIAYESGTGQVALIAQALNLLFAKRGKPRVA